MPPRALGAVPGLDLAGQAWPVGASGFALRAEPTDDDPWTLAGRRLLAAGGARSGLQELWCHPFRLVRDASLAIDGAVPGLVWLDTCPDRVERVLEAGEFTAAERWATALEAAVFDWEVEAEGAAIEIEWVTDFRRMWPYPAGALGPVELKFGASAGQEQRDRLLVGPRSGEALALVLVTGGAVRRVDDASAGGIPGLRIRVVGRDRLRVVVIAGVDAADLERAIRVVARGGLEALGQERLRHAERIRVQQVAIEAPSADLERGFEWAKLRLDSFVAETPGVGRSLLAGYARSRPGWGDGRPGYAWYFGRDACWTAFASLAAGDREAARDVLRFLSRTEDVSGKVLHEYSTSGLVHYDAADSTPLYLLLAGRYAAWTGDLEYLERYWPAIEAAYRFALETDRDGDGLIENHRVGHGWIEHGPLGGARVTLYLAACWVAALEALAPAARALGHATLADELGERGVRARQSVADRFVVGGEYALGLMADGRPQLHRTAMLAVPILLGLVRPEQVSAWYDDIAGDRFTAPWGVRMIGTDDPLFDPAGYHQGAIWPLYTGWVSLAEWRGRRYGAALAHLMANAGLAFERARGAFDEVLHGLERKAAGICPDQAWSAAMVVSPVVEGMWGVVPDAIGRSVSLAPHLPDGWGEMTLRRLRVGGTLLDCRLRRRGGALVLNLAVVTGPPIRVNCVLRGDRPGRLLLDDDPLGGPGGAAGFELRSEAELRLEPHDTSG
jgi:familyl 116 glycosyl hydrolase-like protein